MGHIESIVGNLLKDLSTSIRKFTAFIFLVFAAGVVFAIHIFNRNDITMLQLAYIVPILLALGSYYFTEIAIAFFLLFVLVLFLL